MSIDMEVSDPWFDHIKYGRKTIEGRKKSQTWGNLKVGDRLRIFRKGNPRDIVEVDIEDIRYYPTLYDFFKHEDITKMLPGIRTIEDGMKVYLSPPLGTGWNTREEIEKYGFMAIEIKRNDQSIVCDVINNMVMLEIQSYMQKFHYNHYHDDDYYRVPPTKITIPNVTGSLYLSGMDGLSIVRPNSVSLVISLEVPMILFDDPTEDISHKVYRILDYEDDEAYNKMKIIINETHDVIHNALVNGKGVLIHCMAGISRSTTVVAYYLFKHHSDYFKCGSKDLHPIVNIIKFLKEQRKCIQPNNKFMKLLIEESTSDIFD